MPSTPLCLFLLVFSLVTKVFCWGCGTQSSWTFDSTNHTNITLNDRSFYVHLPSTYSQNVATPLVLSFHGYNDSEVYQETISGFSQDGIMINNTSPIAVYPLGAYGPGKTPNMGLGQARAWQGTPYAQAGVDDISFVQNIISQVSSNLCVDPNRIYAAGKSAGGGFTNLLACTNTTSSLFAAFAPVSAALYPGTLSFTGCNPGRPVPIINFHGLNDTTIPFAGRDELNGNTSYATPNITVWRSVWAARNNCSSPATPQLQSVKQDNAAQSSWSCPAPPNTISAFSVDDLGHSWPTTEGLDQGGVAEFNATPAYVIPFFNSHALSNSFDYTISSGSSSGAARAVAGGRWAVGLAPLLLLAFIV